MPWPMGWVGMDQLELLTEDAQFKYKWFI